MNTVNKQLLEAAKALADEAFKSMIGGRGDLIDGVYEAIAAAEQAQQAEPVNQQRAGVYRKFNVSRTDGRDQPGGDRHGAEYFVLDVTHDKFAKAALAAYAAACRGDYPSLADDMVRRYGIAQQQAEPVAAQCRFEGEEWKYCTIAHHLLVQAHPKEWPHYETRALYAQPPAVGVPTIKLGIYGKAFDSPQTRRAYTYREQPDNIGAYKLGRAVLRAASGGDSIDYGLSLLKQLQAEGFGVFELGDQQEGGAA